MAATIMFQIKNIGSNKKLSDFITIVNNFIESQEMTSIKSNIDDGILFILVIKIWVQQKLEI